MKNLFDLTDKVAIITGGGGALGGGLAEALANYGCDVVLTGRTVSTLAETVKKVEKIGRKALAVKCDVTSEADNEEVVRQTIATFGKVDLFVLSLVMWVDMQLMEQVKVR